MSTLESIDIIAAIDPENFPIIESFRDYHEGVTITDKIGTVLFMNKVQLKMDDFIKKETIGRTVTELYRVDEGHSPTMACLKTGKIVKNLAVYYRTHLVLCPKSSDLFFGNLKFYAVLRAFCQM